MTERVAIESPDFDLAFDARPARWGIGLVALATDPTTERDFARMAPGDEVAVYVNRIENSNPTKVENLRAMQPRLTDAGRRLRRDRTSRGPADRRPAPYSRALSAPFVAFFEGHGLEVANLACFGIEDDTVMARITPESIDGEDVDPET